jgi:hypothetical protein
MCGKTQEEKSPAALTAAEACSIAGQGASCTALALTTSLVAAAVAFWNWPSSTWQVKADCAEDFENVWKTRESHLKDMPGFVRFALLKCE